MKKILERLNNNKTVNLIKTAFISFTLLLSFIPLSSVAAVNTNITVTPENGYYFDLGSGQGGWQTDGLWHITTNRAYSPTHSFGYGAENTKTYNTGGPNSGNLTSPPITLASNSQPVLYFWSWYQTENSKDNDKKIVQISVNDGQWTDLKQITDAQKTWNKETIDISGYAGNTIRLRFLFDTVDDKLNNFEGWYVDSIEISSGTTSTATPQTSASTPTATASADTNLIVNPGFENGSSTPSNWVFRTQNGNTPIWETAAHSGSRSVHISVPGTTQLNGGSGQAKSDSIPSAPNTSYTLSGWGKVANMAPDGTTSGNIVLMELDSGGNWLRNSGSITWTMTNAPTGWSQKSANLTTGANTAFVVVVVNEWNSYGDFWADDLSLKDPDINSTSTTIATPASTSTPTATPDPTPAPTATQAPTSTPASVSNGPTYYVATNGNDGNSGSSSAPWRTIKHAADTVSAGATVYVMGGTYNEKVTITKSGSSGNYITFAAYPGQTPTIDGTGISLGSWDGLVRIYGASYITISGFHVIHSSFMGIMATSNYAGSYPSNILIKNNYVSDTSSSAIFAEDGSYITYDGNEITQAQTMKGLSGQSNEIMNIVRTNNFEIKNNYLHDNANFESITVKDGSSYGTIHHNEVTGSTSHNSFSAGIYVDAQGRPSQNIDVYQNKVHDAPTSGARGIAVGSESVPGTGSMKNVRIFNNIVWNVGAIGIVAGPSHSAGVVDNIKVVNNIVYHNGLVDGWGGGIIAEYKSATNVYIANNIVSQNQARGQISTDNGGNSVVTNNLIDSNSQISGSNYVSGNPQFVNPSGSNFHTQSASPAIDKGTSTDAPDIDFDVNSRPKGKGYDIGAYEYQQ